MSIKRKREILPLQPMPQFTADTDPTRKEEVLRAIDALNSRIIQISPGEDFSDQFLELVGKAQAASESNNWGEAYRQLWGATFLLNRGIESRNNRRLALLLAFAPLATFGALALLAIIAAQFQSPGALLYKVPEFVKSWLTGEYMPYLWSGALGGTTIAWWGIVKHTIRMDFDDQYQSWYWFKPLLGAIFGVVSVIIIQSGMVGLAQSDVTVKNTSILHIVAFLAGFSERFFVQLIDRVMTALFGGESGTTQVQVVEAPSQPAAPPTADEEEAGKTETGKATGREAEHPGLP